MKPTMPAKILAVSLFLPLLFVVAVLALPGRTAAAAKDTTVNVDYVIALLDSGVERAKIVERIDSQNLTFRLAPGDVARLRAAGADDKLIDAVVDHAAVLEGQGQASAQGTDRWSRPSRLGNPAGSGQEQAPPADDEQQYQQQVGEDGQGIEEAPYDGGYGGGSYGYYPGYYSGYYDYYGGYPYPYYYSYPYGAYFHYSSPYYSYYPRHYYYGYGYSGHGGGGVRSAPRGTHSGAPRSGGGSHSAPRSAPRGSRH